MNQFNIVINLVSVSVFEFKYLIFTLYVTLVDDADISEPVFTESISGVGECINLHSFSSVAYMWYKTWLHCRCFLLV